MDDEPANVEAPPSRDEQLAQWDSTPLYRKPGRVRGWLSKTHGRQWTVCLLCAVLGEGLAVGILLWVDSGWMQWGNVPTWVGANLTAAAVSLALATGIGDRHERAIERSDEAKQQARLIVALPHPDGGLTGPVTLRNCSDKPVFRVRARQATDIAATDYRAITIRSGFRGDSIVNILESGATYELLAEVVDFVNVRADHEGNHKAIVRLNGPIEVEFTDALGARWRKTYQFVGYMDSDPERVTGR